MGHNAGLTVYEKRLAEAIAARPTRLASESAVEIDALVLEVNQALGDQAAVIDGLRRGVASMIAKERDRADADRAKYEKRIAELERTIADLQAKEREARIAERERVVTENAKLETRLAAIEQRIAEGAKREALERIVAERAGYERRVVELERAIADMGAKERETGVADRETRLTENAKLETRLAAIDRRIAEGAKRETVERIVAESTKHKQRLAEVERTAATVEKKFETRLVASERRTEEAEACARAAETALTELRGLVRNDFIRLSDDLRERTRDAASAPAAELRADVEEKFAALRSELGEKMAALSARPAFDQGQIDRTFEVTTARTRIEMRALETRLEEQDRAFEERIAEFERRTVAAEERAGGLETVVVELRQQVCTDAIRLADDLRARTRDASLAATTELRSELESTFAAREAVAEKRTDRAEERVRTLEADQVELRVQVRDEGIRTTDDLRHRIDDAIAVAGLQLRSELESEFAARLAEAEKRAERAEERAGALEIAMVELRGSVRDDVVKACGDLRQQARDATVATIAELYTEVEAKIAAVAERPGKLAIAKTYKPGAVVYRGDLVVHHGTTWQAKCDTAQTAGGSDYVCVARESSRGSRPDEIRVLRLQPIAAFPALMEAALQQIRLAAASEWLQRLFRLGRAYENNGPDLPLWLYAACLALLERRRPSVHSGEQRR